MVATNVSAAMDECEKNHCCRMFYYNSVDDTEAFGYCDETADVLITNVVDILYKKGIVMLYIFSKNR